MLLEETGNSKDVPPSCGRFELSTFVESIRACLNGLEAMFWNPELQFASVLIQSEHKTIGTE
jgi:hypothetical protein